jgi:ABC-2 type transport system ATP-binding protein
MRVRDVLTYYSRLKGMYDCRNEIQRWLELLGASEWANKKIDALSKGMAQKIQFIAAVVAKPQLVILDEPFSGLDPVNLETLKDAVLALRNNGTTILFSTHDMEMAEKMCDTILMIFMGRKVLDGSLEAIQANYPADRIRVRFADETQSLPHLPGIVESESNGRFHYFRMQDPARSQQVLQELSRDRVVTHFEVVKPSLHDIFVSIARPKKMDEPRV